MESDGFEILLRAAGWLVLGLCFGWVLGGVLQARDNKRKEEKDHEYEDD